MSEGRRGAKRRLEDVSLLADNSQPLWEPETQEPAVTTEDMMQEQQAAISALGVQLCTPEILQPFFEQRQHPWGNSGCMLC